MSAEQVTSVVGKKSAVHEERVCCECNDMCHQGKNQLHLFSTKMIQNYCSDLALLQ